MTFDVCSALIRRLNMTSASRQTQVYGLHFRTSNLCPTTLVFKCVPLLQVLVCNRTVSSSYHPDVRKHVLDL